MRVECGEGFPLLSGVGVWDPCPENLLNFYIKIVSSRAFWVSANPLVARFTEIGSMYGIEIYWRSFQHFGNYNYSLRKIVRTKMTKMG